MKKYFSVLREINTRDEGDSEEHVQSAIKWKKDIVQVKYIENVTNSNTFQPRFTDETVNGLKINGSSCNSFMKPSINVNSETGSIGSLNFIEKICAIDDLCLNDTSSQAELIMRFYGVFWNIPLECESVSIILGCDQVPIDPSIT